MKSKKLNRLTCKYNIFDLRSLCIYLKMDNDGLSLRYIFDITCNKNIYQVEYDHVGCILDTVVYDQKYCEFLNLCFDVEQNFPNDNFEDWSI